MARNSRVAGASLSVLLQFVTAGISSGADLHVLSAVGMRQVLREVVPKFERANGCKVTIVYDSGARIRKRVEAGERVDLIMIPRREIDGLLEAARLLPGSIVNVAVSYVALAVPSGAPKPDISSPQALKRTLLAAGRIACPDPKLGGSSGLHIAEMFDQLGIADAVRPKLVLASAPDQEMTMPGQLLASGKADLALHQVQELRAVPGIEIVGALPRDLQGNFLFSGAITAGAKDIEAAKALLRFLCSAPAKATIKAKGMISPGAGSTSTSPPYSENCATSRWSECLAAMETKI